MNTQDRGVCLGGPCCRAVECFVGLARFFCDDYSAGRRIVVAGRDLSPFVIVALIFRADEIRERGQLLAMIFVGIGEANPTMAGETPAFPYERGEPYHGG